MADITIASERPDDLWPLVNGLEAGGHRVTVGSPGVESSAALIVIDAVKDLARGRDHCRAARARAPRTPVVALVAADAVDAIGPDWEIDSFIIEGAAIPEVLARVRLAIGTQASGSEGTVRVGDLTIDPETYQVRLRGRPLDLTYKEFQLLFFLAQRPGRVFSRQQLLQEVWGYDFFGGTRTVDVHVRRLRAKLGAEHEGMIATIRNVGYKMESHRART